MMRALVAVPGAVAFAMLLSGCGGGGGGGGFAGAEPAITGGVVGEVRNADGQPVGGALLAVRGSTVAIRSDADGHFFLGTVPIGNQIIDVTSTTVTVSVSVTVLQGQTINVGVISVTGGTGGTGGGGGGGGGGGTSQTPPPPPFRAGPHSPPPRPSRAIGDAGRMPLRGSR